MTIIVAPLSRVPALLGSRKPSHVITLVSPETDLPAYPEIPAQRRLELRFNDIAEPTEGLVAPDRAMIRALIDFGRSWDAAAAPILIHCWAGISRSTAAAFILACQKSQPGWESDIARALRRASPVATPNRLMVQIADDLLGRSGAMVTAVTAIGRGLEAVNSVPFDLQCRDFPPGV